MQTKHIKIENKRATYNKADGTIVCGNKGYKIEFEFDSEWDAYEEKKARFTFWRGGMWRHIDVKIEENTCAVPVLVNVKFVKVGVFVENYISTSNNAIIDCERGALCGGSKDIYDNFELEERAFIVSKDNIKAGVEVIAPSDKYYGLKKVSIDTQPIYEYTKGLEENLANIEPQIIAAREAGMDAIVKEMDYKVAGWYQDEISSQQYEEDWENGGYKKGGILDSVDLPSVDLLKRITDFRGFLQGYRYFEGGYSLESLWVRKLNGCLDTSSGVEFSDMFRNCEYLEEIPEGIDTSNGTNFSYMFDYCSLLVSVPELDTSKGTNFVSMFNGCSNLSNIPALDTSNGTNFYTMFRNCSKLSNIPALDTSKGTNFGNMFSYCSLLVSVPELDTSNGTNFTAMFNGCSNLSSIPALDTRKSSGFATMFYNCSSLVTIPKLDARACTSTNSFNNTFYGCKALTNLTIKNIKANLTIGSASTYGHLLTVDSLVGIIYELINVSASRTLTVGSANLTKLANVYVKQIPITDEMRAEDEFIDSKLPFVVCNSTDEGATLIKTYAYSKGWTLK